MFRFISRMIRAPGTVSIISLAEMPASVGSDKRLSDILAFPIVFRGRKLIFEQNLKRFSKLQQRVGLGKELRKFYKELFHVLRDDISGRI